MFAFFIFCILFFVFLCWYCFIFEPYNFKVEKVKIHLENLPRTFENARFVQISDIHSKSFGRKEKTILRFFERIKPDYIFITGDIIDYRTKDLEPCRPFWSILGQKYAGRIFAVFGNHLHQNTKINNHFFKKILTQDGISVLLDENKKLQRGEDFIYVIGVDDSQTKHHDLEKARSGIQDGFVKILLAHSSEIIEDFEPGDADLILCGHTHGGQVRLPLIRPYWDMTKYRGRYSCGLFKVKDAYLYVNRGIGTSILPLRFNCSPEITLIELKKNKIERP